MTLPEGFQFSQNNLQDYVDCKRRFQLKHLLRLAWPAVEAEPYLENEQRIDQGAKFHQIVRQFLLGIPEASISQTINGDELMESWWSNYLRSFNDGNLKMISEHGNQCFEEIALSIPLEGFRLIAKYDLLIIHPNGNLTILDWKTSQRHPKLKWLANRLQTQVYPLVLMGAASEYVEGSHVDPDKIEMVYWFTNQPDQPEHFRYNQSNYQADIIYLGSLISAIKNETEPIFPLTPDLKRCLFCTYRSLCNRGVEPGDLQHFEEWQENKSPEEITLDFDQIGEIEF